MDTFVGVLSASHRREVSTFVAGTGGAEIYTIELEAKQRAWR
jgi:hypothetical protein